jgi:insulysin
VIDLINEVKYTTEVAGLRSLLKRGTDGLFLVIYGFNDNLHLLLEKIVCGMRNLIVTQNRFDVKKDSLLRQLQNWRFDAPYDHAMQYTKYLLTTCQWTNYEKEQALKGGKAPNNLRNQSLTIQALTRSLVPRP